MKWTLILVALLAGCNAHVHVSSGSVHSGISVNAAGGPALAVLTGVAAFGIVYHHERDFGGGSLPAPELAPDRKVSEQDCTKPIDWSLGNLRCK